MLILSRKLNESIVIDGKIVVKILRIERDTVKLGIQAPPELSVHRQEIFDLIQKNLQAAAGHSHTSVSAPGADRVVAPPNASDENSSKPTKVTE